METAVKTLETKDLTLRPFRMTDLNDFYEYARKAEIGPQAGWKPHPDKTFSAKILQGFIKNKDVYAIVLKSENKVIGSIGLHVRPLEQKLIELAELTDLSQKKYAEIGYVLNSDYWRRGYMTQAVSAVIFHAFQNLKLDFLTVSHAKENLASQGVIQKCGFRFVAEREKELPFLDGITKQSLFYILQYDKEFKLRYDKTYDEMPIW